MDTICNLCNSSSDLKKAYDDHFSGTDFENILQNLSNIRQIFLGSKRNTDLKRKSIPVFEDNFEKLKLLLSFVENLDECLGKITHYHSTEEGKLNTANHELWEQSERVSELLRSKENMCRSLEQRILQISATNKKLVDENKTKSDEISQKIKEIGSKCDEIGSLRRIVQTEKDKNQKLLTECDRLDHEKRVTDDKLNTSVKNKDEEIQKLVEQCNSLKHDIHEKEEGIKHFEKALQLRHVENDASQQENTRDVMQIAEEYEGFCRDTWLIAKQTLDGVPEGTIADYLKLTLLSDLIMTAFSACHSVLEKVYILIEEPFAALRREKLEPEEHLWLMAVQVCLHHSYTQVELSQQFKLSLRDGLRSEEDQIDFAQLIQSVITSTDNMEATSNELTEKVKLWKSVQCENEIRDFIQQILKISWKMVIQDSPMTLKTSEVWTGGNIQEKYWNSKDTDNPVIYSVHPMLSCDDRILRKEYVLVLDKHHIK